MKKLIGVFNSSDGHLSFLFDKATRTRDYIADFDQGMIIVFGDNDGRDIVEVEVLFIDDPGRVQNLMYVKALYHLNISPFFDTYEGQLTNTKVY